MLTVKVFQLCYMFENFYNKMLERKKQGEKERLTKECINANRVISIIPPDSDNRH